MDDRGISARLSLRKRPSCGESSARSLLGTCQTRLSKTLNAENVLRPRGGAWSPSTIHGNALRGTGILNNELYIGRIVWNRPRFVEDPDDSWRRSSTMMSATRRAWRYAVS